MEQAAWEWEMDRSAFKTGRRWSELHPQEQISFAAYFKTSYPLMRDHDTNYLAEGFLRLHADAHAATTIQLHVLEIDWFAPPSAIKRALAKWVDAHPTCKRKLAKTLAQNPAMAALLPKKRKGGRPRSYIGLLLDLAMQRLQLAKVPRVEAVKLLELLAQRSGVESSADNKLSPQHWLTTVARVAREITKRRKRKLRVSSLLGLH